MLNKDQKSLMSCIETVMNKETHKKNLMMITSHPSHKNSTKLQTRQKFLTEWSDLHTRVKAKQDSFRNKQIDHQNEKIISRLYHSPLSVPKHTSPLKKSRSNSYVNRNKQQKRIENQNLKIKNRIIKAMSHSQYRQKKKDLGFSRLSGSNSTINYDSRIMRRIPATNLAKLSQSKNLANYTELIKLGNLQDLSLESSNFKKGMAYQHQRNFDLINKAKHCHSVQRMRQAAKLHLQKKEHEKMAKGKIFNTENFRGFDTSDL